MKIEKENINIPTGNIDVQFAFGFVIQSHFKAGRPTSLGPLQRIAASLDCALSANKALVRAFWKNSYYLSVSTRSSSEI